MQIYIYKKNTHSKAEYVGQIGQTANFVELFNWEYTNNIDGPAKRIYDTLHSINELYRKQRKQHAHI